MMIWQRHEGESEKNIPLATIVADRLHGLMELKLSLLPVLLSHHYCHYCHITRAREHNPETSFGSI
jgi:hypothetical protein